MSTDSEDSKDNPGQTGPDQSPPGDSRTGRNLALGVAAGLASALLFLSVAAQLLAPLPLMLLGLGPGMTALSVGAAAGMAAVAVKMGAVAAPVFGVMVALPAFIVVRQGLLWRRDGQGAVHYYPPGLLLAWLSVAAVALMLAGAAFAPENPQGFQGAVHDYVVTILGMIVGDGPEVQEMIRLWVPLFPAMVAGVWLLSAVGNGALAQAMLTRFRRNRRPTPAYRELWLPGWLLAALAAALALGFAAGGDLAYLGRNAAVVLVVPFAFLGLTLVHDLARRQSSPGLLLGIFYAVFFLLPGVAAFAVAGLGLMRHWVRLRRRMSGGSSQEEK